MKRSLGRPPKKIALLLMSAQLLANMCKPGERHFDICHNALPRDAKVVGGHYNSLTDVFEVAIHSRYFKAVSEGHPVPVLPPPMMTDLRYAKEGRQP